MSEPTYAEWLASRPAIVQAVLRRFPPMTRVLVDDITHYVMGADEDGGVILSPVNPVLDYEGAMAEKLNICADCLREVTD